VIDSADIFVEIQNTVTFILDEKKAMKILCRVKLFYHVQFVPSEII